MCYHPKHITPYIHCFVYHIPEFIQLHKDISIFTLQGLEKLNHITSICYHRSNNKKMNEKVFVKQLIEKMSRIEFLRLGFDNIIDFNINNNDIEGINENAIEYVHQKQDLFRTRDLAKILRRNKIRRNFQLWLKRI